MTYNMKQNVINLFFRFGILCSRCSFSNVVQSGHSDKRTEDAERWLTNSHLLEFVELVAVFFDCFDWRVTT